MSVKNSAHWLDQLTYQILSWQEQHHLDTLHVDDMKTPSGRIHTGSLRGVILHDLIAKNLQAKATSSTSVVNTYVFNDMDPMDGLPDYLDQEIYIDQMGKPFFKIPKPDLEKSGLELSLLTDNERAEIEQAKNFAEVYAIDFVHTFRRLGCDAKIIWSHELYESGQMDAHIKTSLDNVDTFKKIYKEVADYKLPKNWYPFQVICPQCGKLGTTLVTDWDGVEVTFECQENKVTWAKGCGHQGKISPFGGNGKLLWKVDWPAHWQALGINIEGAGKDHTSAGGSRDMADAIVTQVFKSLVPFNIPYEWILVRGSKMSSSKGVGTSAREFTHLFPPEIGRFLFANRIYSQVIDFDPRTMAIPDLFDEYDQGARIFWRQESGDERLGRSFELAAIHETTKACFLPRFRDVALWMQYPEMDLVEKFGSVKGSPLNAQELSILEQRKRYAATWLRLYAPSEFQFTPKVNQLAPKVDLSAEQKDFLKQVGELLDQEKVWPPEELQQELFELAKKTCGPRQGFEAIYQIFLGKKSGPKAAWFLLNITPEFRSSRLKKLN